MQYLFVTPIPIPWLLGWICWAGRKLTASGGSSEAAQA
jgi:hypothetical protein